MKRYKLHNGLEINDYERKKEITKQSINYLSFSDINIDIFVILMNKNNFSQLVLDMVDEFKKVWNENKKENWPERRKYTEWRYEFYTWIRWVGI